MSDSWPYTFPWQPLTRPILQKKKQRPRKVKSLAQGLTTMRDSIQLCASSPTGGTLCSLWLLFGFWQLKPTKNSQLHTNPGVSKGQVQGAGVTRRVFLHTPWLCIPFAVVTLRNRRPQPGWKILWSHFLVIAASKDIPRSARSCLEIPADPGSWEGGLLGNTVRGYLDEAPH